MKSAIEQMPTNSLEYTIAREHCIRDEFHLSNSNHSWEIEYDVVKNVNIEMYRDYSLAEDSVTFVIY